MLSFLYALTSHCIDYEKSLYSPVDAVTVAIACMELSPLVMLSSHKWAG